MSEWTVETSHPLAVGSGDTKRPHGAAFRGTSSPEFIAEVERLFGKPASVLCLGCSGGRLVEDLLLAGHEAVGLDGANHHALAGTASWGKLYQSHLFTADIAERFRVLRDGHPATFDVITAWDVLEHIEQERLPVVMANIQRHLEPSGLFIATIGLLRSVLDGVVYHHTVKPRDWWHGFLSAFLDYAGAGKLSVEAWEAMTCWHGPNRDQKRDTRYIGRLKTKGGG